MATVGRGVEDTSEAVQRTFGGIRPVLHIPFGPKPNQVVEHAELRVLVRRMLETGVDGIVVLGLGSGGVDDPRN